MGMKRRQRKPDKRLDWRDPDMPVLRPWEEPWGAVVLKAIRPEEEQEFRDQMQHNGNPLAPGWRDDKTYNIARPGARNHARQLTTHRRRQ